MNNNISSDCLCDRTTDLIVSSYIRKSEILLFYSLMNDIPSDIKSITLSYVGNHFMLYRGSRQWQITNLHTIQSSLFKITNIKWQIEFTTNDSINLNILSMDSLPSHWNHISIRISLQCHEINKQLITNKQFQKCNLYPHTVMKLPLNDLHTTNISNLTVVISVTILRITKAEFRSLSTNRIQSLLYKQHLSSKQGFRRRENTIYDQKYETGKYWIEDILIAANESTLTSIKNMDQWKILFIKKLQLCCIKFDFNVKLDKNHERAKELKCKYLAELGQCLSMNSSKKCFSDDCVPVIVEMIGINLFRSFPPSQFADYDPDDDDEPNLDPAWPHLQLVYKLFYAFICKAHTRSIERHINKGFIIRMMGLFNSEDPRERDFLKLILHSLYGRVMPFRSYIRKTIGNIFYNAIYSGIKHNGIAETLEFCGSIITGFKVPLKDEHKLFFHNILIPLHKISYVSQFHDELLYCVLQFIQKDQSLVMSVTNGLLKFWPMVSSEKELLFVNELGQLAEHMNSTQLEMISVPLFNRISKCICSMNLKVAKRSLYLWNNDRVGSFITEHRKQILPIVYPSLQKNLSHWSYSVKSLSICVLNKFREIDNKLYSKVDKHYRNNRQKKQ